MYLDREDMRNIANGIAKKFAKDPVKWRNIITNIDPRIGCGLSFYGSEGEIPTSDEAAHALNFMHMTVNGIKPYREVSGSGGGLKDNCPSYGPDCIDEGGFEPCDCGSSTGYLCTPCISPDDHGCGTATGYKCNDTVQCNQVFKCDGYECPEEKTFGDCPGHFNQKGGNCPDPEVTHFSCNSYSCTEGSEFVCTENPRKSFGCENEGSKFDCYGEYGCPSPGSQGANHDCSASERFGCYGTHGCSTPLPSKYDCVNQFNCGSGDQGQTHGCLLFDCQPEETFTCDPSFDEEGCGYNL